MEEQNESDREAWRSWLHEELITTALQLEPIRKLSSDALLHADLEKMKDVVLGLLKILFGDGVSRDNIRERLETYRSKMEECITENSEVDLVPGENSVINGHILFAQRILVAYFASLYIQRLERNWLDSWSGKTEHDLASLSVLHDVLLKLLLYVRTLPVVVAIRSLSPEFEAEWSSDASLDIVLNDSSVGRASITLDLLQPKENLMVAFEQFIDKAKSRIKENPDNKLLMNLYDFTRKKDGRRNKPPYRDWYRAILDFEDSSEYPSLYGASRGLTVSDEEDPESLRKNLENRSKRFNSLLISIMENTFPSVD